MLILKNKGHLRHLKLPSLALSATLLAACVAEPGTGSSSGSSTSSSTGSSSTSSSGSSTGSTSGSTSGSSTGSTSGGGSTSSTSSSSTSGGTGQHSLLQAINVGGSAVTMDGIDFESDNSRLVSGGTGREITDNIAGGGAVYQSERYGNYTYSIPVSNESYDLVLHFAETYWEETGAREFNVSVEGDVVGNRVDLVALAGNLSAYRLEVDNIWVSDDELNIEIETITDNGTMAGIEIYSVDGEILPLPEPPPRGSGTASEEDTGADCNVGSPSGTNGGSSSRLPDPFTKWDGSAVRTKEDWRCRRRELVVALEDNILGEKAPPPHTNGGTVTGSVSSSSYTVNVSNNGASTSWSNDVSVPSGASAPYPAVVVVGGFNSLNSDVLSSEGVAVVSYDAYEIASESSGDFSTGKYYTVNPDQRGNTSALVAWSWGVSRFIDMLENLDDPLIDPQAIAVHGCSRFGKAAFVIGAFDERIALGLPLEPGTGGPAPLRALPSMGGQTLSSANGEASWFGSMSASRGPSGPVDMNDVAAMYAPRGLLMMDNPHIDHLSYKANYLGTAAAAKVYDAMGAGDAIWYLGSSGNGNHCSTRAEYGAPLRAMIRKFMKGDNSTTTGGLDRHSNHGNINVDSWTGHWDVGTIAQ